MHGLRAGGVLVLLGALLLLSSCSYDAVAQFANQSSQALAQGPAILKDIEGSCLRRQMSQGSYYGLDQPELAAKPTAEAAQFCAEYTNETPGLLVAAKTLTDYFTALSQLASAGKASAGKNAQQDKSAASAAAKTAESITLMKSAGTIIDAIGRMATEGYRQKHLEKDLQGVAKDVDALLAELKKDADVRYVGLLTAEQRAYERQFSVALQDLGAPTSNDPSQLQLIRTLARDDESAQARLIAAKRSAAMSYGKAIDTILSGHRALLDHRGKLDAKDVSGMIQPYTDSLSKLVQPLWQLFGG